VSNLAAEKAAEVGLPVDSHPAERSRPKTPPIKRNPESQSHLITPPKKTQQQSLAQFLETTEASSGGAFKDTPESPDQHNKLKKKSGGGGFKKMFGRNKNRDSLQSKPPSVGPASAAATEKAQGQSQTGGGATLGRRFSGFRKKSQQDVSSFGKPSPSMTTSHAPASIAESEDRTPTRSPEIGAAQQAFERERSYNPSVQESLSRVDTADAHEARQAFSSFDQGPLEDVPAFVPGASPEASPRHSVDVPAAPAPTRSPAVLAAIEKLEKSNQAVLTKAPKTPLATAGKGEDKTVSPVGDRWAQIRKNAAERAAARQSEDQKSAGTDGDGGETSGEETIESRVARIKARVAELTGNMENGAPAAPAGPPRR
ncbi:hypothetical protein V493_03689, partial [Pseudogymnoascus sp. VKM F-4281 (FW-2241)]